MAMIGDEDLAGREHVVTNADAVTTGDMHHVIQIDSIAYDNRGHEFLA